MGVMGLVLCVFACFLIRLRPKRGHVLVVTVTGGMISTSYDDTSHLSLPLARFAQEL